MITVPVLLFGFVIALLIGAIYHAIRGGDGWQLVLYLFLSMAGFAAGQWTSMARNWFLFTFGALDIGVGVLGSVLFLAIGDLLTRAKPGGKSSV